MGKVIYKNNKKIYTNKDGVECSNGMIKGEIGTKLETRIKAFSKPEIKQYWNNKTKIWEKVK